TSWARLPEVRDGCNDGNRPGASSITLVLLSASGKSILPRQRHTLSKVLGTSLRTVRLHTRTCEHLQDNSSDGDSLQSLRVSVDAYHSQMLLARRGRESPRSPAVGRAGGHEKANQSLRIAIALKLCVTIPKSR